MNFDWIEWMGYLASFLVLISLLMSSILKLRWINLVGSIMFSIYGFLIGSLPVALMNLATASINVYYLIKIYKSYQTKEYFKLLEIDSNSKYLEYFMDFHNEGIKKYISNRDFSIKDSTVGFYILRNLVPAGIFLGSKYDENTLLIDFDFVIPEYRDFKIGKYIYEEQQDYFINLGYTRLISYLYSDIHNDYLIKMGFKESVVNNRKVFVKKIAPSI